MSYTTPKPESTDSENFDKTVLNCEESVDQQDDWRVQHAINAGVPDPCASYPGRLDLRQKWWKIYRQKDTGVCVGYDAAYGVLWWHYVQTR